MSLFHQGYLLIVCGMLIVPQMLDANDNSTGSLQDAYAAIAEKAFPAVVVIEKYRYNAFSDMFKSNLKLINGLTDPIKPYQQVTKNGKIIADSTLKTVPRWRETLAAAKVCVTNLGRTAQCILPKEVQGRAVDLYFQKGVIYD